MKQDLDEAYHLFEQLAEKGLPAAKYNLAIFCLDGYPNGREAQRAVQLLEEAAAGGVKIAHVTLAQIYMEGVDEVQQDFDKATDSVAPLLKTGPAPLRRIAKDVLKEIDRLESEK